MILINFATNSSLQIIISYRLRDNLGRTSGSLEYKIKRYHVITVGNTVIVKLQISKVGISLNQLCNIRLCHTSALGCSECVPTYTCLSCLAICHRIVWTRNTLVIFIQIGVWGTCYASHILSSSCQSVENSCLVISTTTILKSKIFAYSTGLTDCLTISASYPTNLILICFKVCITLALNKYSYDLLLCLDMKFNWDRMEHNSKL